VVTVFLLCSNLLEMWDGRHILLPGRCDFLEACCIGSGIFFICAGYDRVMGSDILVERLIGDGAISLYKVKP
jgi:hypothetical protein